MANLADIHKGSRVLVHATVFTKSQRRFQGNATVVYQTPTPISALRTPHPRHLRRVEEKQPWEGIAVGRSRLITGVHYWGYGNDDPGELRDCKYHPVILVIPARTERFLAPFACLVEDLELL